MTWVFEYIYSALFVKSFTKFTYMVTERYFGDINNFNYGKTVMDCLKDCNLKKYKEISGGEYDCSIGEKEERNIHKTLLYLKNNWR